MAGERVELHLSGGGPWGFRLFGGEQLPLIVSKLRKRSKAHNAGLQEGDILVSINGKNVEGKSHPDAMSLVDAAGNDIDMVVMRGSETARQFGIGVEPLAPVKQAAAPAPVEQPKPLKVAKIPAVNPTSKHEPGVPAPNVAPSQAKLNLQQPNAIENIEKHNVTEETFKQGDSTHNIRTEVKEGTVGNTQVTKISRQEKITSSSGNLGHSGGKQIFKVKNIAERLGGKIDQTHKISPSSFEPGRQFGEVKKTAQPRQFVPKSSQPESDLNPFSNPGIQFGDIKKTPKVMPGPGPKFQVRNVQANVLQPSQITLGLSNSQPKPEEPAAPQPKIWTPSQPSTKENVSPSQMSPVSKAPQFNVRRISGAEKPPTWQPTQAPQPEPPKENVNIPIQHDPPSEELPMEQDEPPQVSHTKGHFWASPNKQVSVLRDEVMDTSPDSSIASGRKSKKKMYADSAFYDDPDAQYPSIEEQIEMCRKVAAQLTSPANQKARGAKMFMKRVKKAGKWTHAGSEHGSSGSGPGDIGNLDDVAEPYEPPSPDPNSALFSFKIPKFSSADLLGGREKLKTKLSAQDLENMRLSKPKNVHNTVPAEACFSLASALQEAKGRGGKIFEKRRAKSENWIVDESNVKETPPPPPKSAGPETGGQKPPRNRLKEMIELGKAEVTPWEAAAEDPYGNLDKAFTHIDKYKRDVAAAEIKADLSDKTPSAPGSSSAPSTAMWTPASQASSTAPVQFTPHKTPPPTLPKRGGKAVHNKKPMGWSSVGQPNTGLSSHSPQSQSTAAPSSSTPTSSTSGGMPRPGQFVSTNYNRKPQAFGSQGTGPGSNKSWGSSSVGSNDSIDAAPSQGVKKMNFKAANQAAKPFGSFDPSSIKLKQHGAQPIAVSDL